MSLHTGQENRQVDYHAIGEWYEMHNGVVFRIYEPPQRVFNTDLHTGHVQLLDGSYTVLAWGPRTRLRPSWIRRAVRAIGRFLTSRAPLPEQTQKATVPEGTSSSSEEVST